MRLYENRFKTPQFVKFFWWLSLPIIRTYAPLGRGSVKLIRALMCKHEGQERRVHEEGYPEYSEEIHPFCARAARRKPVTAMISDGTHLQRAQLDRKRSIIDLH